MAICKRGVIQALVSFLGVEILTTFWFLWYNFWSRYARKPIKGSKNSWDNLISKKYLGQNVGPFHGRPGPRKVGHKNAKTPPLVTSPQENPKLKTEHFFWLGTRNLAESVEGLNISLAAAAGELWPNTCEPIYWPDWSLNIALSIFAKCVCTTKYSRNQVTSAAMFTEK